MIATGSTRAVFRLPGGAVLLPVFLFFCATPLASYRAYLLPLYLLPVGALAYVLWTRTTADDSEIVARTLLTRRRTAWNDLAGFEFHGPRWAIAVTTTGRRFRLPMVRPRDLPVLAAVSGGRLNLTRPGSTPTGGTGSADGATGESSIEATGTTITGTAITAGGAGMLADGSAGAMADGGAGVMAGEPSDMVAVAVTPAAEARDQGAAAGGGNDEAAAARGGNVAKATEPVDAVTAPAARGGTAAGSDPASG